MKKRFLGKSGIAVSEIGLGCMGMDHAYGKQKDRQEMIQLIHRAVEMGCDFFDTAVVYGEENERVVGSALCEMRDKVIIATKFGITGQKVEDGKPVNILDSKPDSIRQQVEGSLKRLKTDYIDLYYQHRLDPEVEPEAVAEVMGKLIKEGKIRAWGVSNAPMEYMRRAHVMCPLAATENQYSMMWREPEKGMFELCEELGISFVAYSPLGSGFLSGKYTKDTSYEEGDFRGFMTRFKPEVINHNQQLLDLISEIANSKNATNTQIALAWVLAQKSNIIPIPGTTKITRLEENLKGAEVILTEKELMDLNFALSKISVNEQYF